MKTLAGLMVLLVLALSAKAANHYVLDGGSGDGSSWSSALDDLPSTFVRGDTYYVGDGNYGAHTFDTAVSGSSYVTIKKATAADHGTATGWDNAYGDGVALFTSGSASITWQFRSSYWMIDGQFGSSTNARGIKVTTPTIGDEGHVIYCAYGDTVDHLWFKSVEIQGSGWQQGNYSVSGFYSNATCTNDVTAPNYWFTNCFVYDCNQMWIYNYSGARNTVIERSYFRNGGSGDAAKHSEGIRIDSNATDMGIVFRNNVVENVTSTGGSGYIGAGADGVGGGWEIYGNVFFDSSALAGPGSYLIGNNVGGGGTSLSNCRVFNNTFVGLRGTCSLFASSGSGNVATNNLWLGCTNAVAFTNFEGGSNATNGVTLGADWKLTAALAGVALAAPYNTDPSGATRGSDGVWDIGAYEFAEDEEVEPAAVSGSATAARVNVETLILR